MKVEDEWERETESTEDLDVLFVTYQPDRVSTDRMIEFFGEHGFKATVQK